MNGYPTMPPQVLDVAGDATGGIPPQMRCLPPDLYGELVESHPNGWAAFESCDEGLFVLQGFGSPPVTSQTAADALFEQYGQSLFGFPGAVVTDVGPCCPDSEEQCLRILVDAWAFNFYEALAYANELLGGLSDVCIGVQVFAIGDLGPRCESGDPTCGPVTCGDAPPYVPEAPRIPVDTEESQGVCAHDGDCRVDTGRCIDFNTPEGPKGPVAGCPDAPLHCGCVEERCSWFEQG